MRLHKYLAECGVASRRKAEAMMQAGRITVNGTVADTPGTQVDPGDVVLVDGQAVQPEAQKVYILYHKPMGEVCTASDPQGRVTVLDRFREIPERLFPVGRLDFDSEGLLLLTNDGALAQKLLHPSHTVDKTYLARVAGHISGDAMQALQRGVFLGDRLTAPAGIRVIRETDVESVVLVTIHEGRNRQVRRMFDAVGCRVRLLRRVQFGPLRLGALRRGEWRTLTAEEIRRLEEI